MIAECPSCQSRYDVSGRAPGTRARCRCGTIFELHAVTLQAGMLHCPQCAASVPEHSHRCEYCTAHLMVKSCPRCLTRIFHGHEHCPKCGAVADGAATAIDTAARQRGCPRCPGQTLIARLIGDVAVDECGRCAGLFIDSAAIERIVAERQQARAEAILGTYQGSTPVPRPASGKLYVKCPDCGVLMNRRQFARSSNVVVDVCRGHGTWFDDGELPAVVSFVMNGGLERAEKLAIADEREAVRRAAADAARPSNRGGFDVHAVTLPTTAAGPSSLVDLMFWLWR